MSLGTYPIVSLTETRQKRGEAKKLVLAGIDPSELRKEQKRAKSHALAEIFEAIAREWYSKRQDRWLSKGHDECL